MKLSNFKNLISSNLLSLSGYAYLLVWLYVYFVVRLDIMNWKGAVGSDPETVGMANSSVFIDVIFSLFVFCFIVSAILILLTILEKFLRKKSQNEFRSINNKAYLITFWLGLILQISPLCMLLVCFFVH